MGGQGAEGEVKPGEGGGKRGDRGRMEHKLVLSLYIYINLSHKYGCCPEIWKIVNGALAQ